MKTSQDTRRNASAQRRTRRLIIASGIAASILLLVVVMNLDRREKLADDTGLDADYERINTPGDLTEAERRSSGGGLDGVVLARLEAGAWIQVADRQGQLAQEYKAAKLDPLPNQRLAMEEPVARFYLSQDRLLVMTADTAEARVPARRIESGRMSGDVVIRLYQHRADCTGQAATDRPSLIVNADEADFDNELGKIRCDRAVKVHSTDHPDAPYAVDFAGEGLTILLATDNSTIRQLVVDRSTSPLRIVPRVRNAPPVLASSAPPPVPAPSAVATPSPVPQSPSMPSPAAPVAAAPIPASSVEPAPAPLFYRLTFEDLEEVRRIRPEGISIITGDTLAVVFSLEGEGLRNQQAAAAPTTWGGQPLGPISSMAMLAIGAAPIETTDEERIEVSYAGRLVMVPVMPDEETPASVDDAFLIVEGSPAKIVDETAEVTMLCRELKYRSEKELVELIGHEDHPLRIAHSRFDAHGERLWYEMTTGRAAFVGPGSMAFLAEQVARVAHLHSATACTDSDLALLVSLAAATQTAPREKDLEITWTEGVDLEFAEEGEEESEGDQPRRLKSAQFAGDVKVSAQDFSLDSRRLRVGFDPKAKGDDAINLIEADGDVKVLASAGLDRMASDHLRVDLTQADGKSMPTSMSASGEVEAVNQDYTLWAESLNVGFVPRTAAPEDQPGKPDAAPGGSLAGKMGNVDVSSVRAERDVQVLLKQGARVFADTMTGDGVAQRIGFHSATADTVLVYDNVVIDRLGSMTFDDGKKKARVDGPGRFSQFKQPVTLPKEGKAPKPEIPDSPTVQSSWKQSMEYDYSFNDGAGAIDMYGDVEAFSHARPLQEDMVKADWVTFQLKFVDPTAPAATAPQIQVSDGRFIDQGDRELAQFFARGNAAVQNKVWDDESRKTPARLFRATGEHIEYNAQTRYARIVSDGSLLIFDERPEAPSASTARKPVFGAKGTTKFTWKKVMECKPQSDGGMEITMDDEVVMKHAGLQEADVLTFSGDRLVATLFPKPKVEGEPNPDVAQAGALDVGGDMDLRRLKGTGRVLITTPDQKKVECHEFDYDRRTNIGKLEGSPGRPVVVLNEGAASDFRARRAIWDFDTGRIQINGASGEGSR